MIRKILFVCFWLLAFGNLLYAESNLFEISPKQGADRELVLGASVYIVHQTTGDSLLLTEYSGAKAGTYYRANVAYGLYKIYVNNVLVKSNHSFGVDRPYQFIEAVDSDGDNKIETAGFELASVTSAILADNLNISVDSLVHETHSLLTTGKNKFNVSDITTGYYINYNTGALAANSSYNCSGYCGIKPSQTYTWSSGCYHMAWYDTDQTYISGVSGALSTHTSPTGAKYVRFSFYTSTDENSIQLEEGSASTDYQSFVSVIDAQLAWNNVDAAENEISTEYLSTFEKTRNLFNPLTITADHYVSWTTGGLSASSTYSASDYIAVSASTNYSAFNAVHYAWYTSAKTFSAGGTSFGDTQTSPANAAYLRVDYLHNNYDSTEIQIEQGDNPSILEPFQYIQAGSHRARTDLKLQLPDTIFVAASGSAEINIFFENVIIGREYKNYNFWVECDSGAYDYRRWHWIPSSGTSGNYKLIIKVQDKEAPYYCLAIDSTIISSASSTLSGAKTILMLGNSLTDDGSSTAEKYPSEVYTLSSASTAMTFIGTQDASTNWSNEGRSGWEYEDFCSSGSPFYVSSSNTFDIANYLSTNGFGNPDYVTIGLGTNDVYGATESTIRNFIDDAFGYQDTMVNDILSALPSCQIGLFLIIPPVYENTSAFTSTGRNRDRIKKNYHEFNRRMIAKWGKNGTDKNARVSLISASPGIDTEYNFSQTTEAANARNSTTITVYDNNVHPAQSGFYQIADCVFGWIVNH